MSTAAARSKRAEKTKEELRKLTLVEENKFCMDCAMRGPLYVVLDFHSFVCSQCSAIHRSLQHKVKGISMSDFSDEELAGMRVGGNAVARRIWLNGFRGPLPREGDERAIRDHIRHIYEEKRYFNADAHAQFLSALTDGLSQHTLPPVQPMPAHIAVQLSAAPAAIPRHVDTRHSSQPQLQPQAQPAQPQNQHHVAAPQAVPAQPPLLGANGSATAPPAQPPQRPVDVFDTIFQQPPPSRPAGDYPQQQPTPAVSLEFLSDSSTAVSQQPMSRQPQQAAQMQMHSTQYQPQMAAPQAVQAQMGSVFDSQRAYGSGGAPPSQPDIWGAQTAQRQMTPHHASYSSETPYAAQHQMNTSSNFSSYSQAPSAPVDFFAQPSHSQAAPFAAPHNRQSAAWEFAGPPPIPADRGSSGYSGTPAQYGSSRAPTVTTNGENGARASNASDPFASLDFFKK